MIQELVLATRNRHKGEELAALLGDLGIRIRTLEEFPDSVFVEDPALVFGEGAILLRPGAPSRAGEREPMRDVLARLFEHYGDGRYRVSPLLARHALTGRRFHG